MNNNVSGAFKPVKRTIQFDKEANDYLTELFPNGRGIGPFCARLVHEHQWRRKHMAHYQAVASKEQWEATGICVD
jgi:hypothetical protein